MKSSYKFSIDLTKEQEIKSKQIFDCCKFVYNYMLELKEYMYKEHNISMSRFELHGLLPVLKETYPFLKQVPSQTLQFIITSLINSFDAFFNKTSNYPGYKRDCNSFVYTQIDLKRNFKVDNIIYIPKLGNILCKFHRMINEENVKTATIKYEDNKWYVILVVDEDNVQKERINNIEDNRIIGIDLGISNYCTLSNGKTYENPKILKTSEKKLTKHQRKLSKKKKGSRNRRNTRNKLRKTHNKIRNQRNDYMHKVTREIVANYDIIIIENLSIKEMQKSKIRNKKRLNKNLADVSLYQTITTLEYKCEKYGKYLIKVDPANTTIDCSVCGRKVKKKLTDRVHICECGTKLDRDLNASINILNKGIKQLRVA